MLIPKPVEIAPCFSKEMILIWIGIPLAWWTIVAVLVYFVFVME